MEELVLLTVGLAYHAPYLRLSHDLLAGSLHGRRWLLVDNSPNQALRALAQECGFQWIEGAAVPEPDAVLPLHAIGSAHHALGLSQGVAAASARYLLILDPDFFLLATDAVTKLLTRMREEQLVALGVPWTPELHYKWRGAPCMHCLLIDLEQIPKAALRFEPAAVLGVNATVRRYARLARLFRPWRPLLSPVHQLTTGRIGIGHSCDTGWQLARWLLQHHPGRVGLLPAAVVDRRRFRNPWHLRYEWGWNLERHLPQHWSYLPPVDHYRLSEGANVSDLVEFGLDAFCLEDSVFAVHVRRSRALFADTAEEAAYVERLSELLNGLAPAPHAIERADPLGSL
jgi:hypothetical protein